MGVRTRMIDDSSIGGSKGGFFKLETAKKRIALIPEFVPDTELVVTDELRARGGRDKQVAEEVETRLALKAQLEKGLLKDPATVERVELPEPGYVGPFIRSAYCHFTQGNGYILCKRDEYIAAGYDPKEATCCRHDEKGAMLMHAFVALQYEIEPGPSARVLRVPANLAIPTGDGHVQDFNYQLLTASLSDSRMRAWKKFHDDNPPILSDYVFYLEPRGTTNVFQCTTGKNPGEWRSRGEALYRKIIQEADELWKGIDRTLGKDMSIEEIDEMYGVTRRTTTRGGESNYNALLNGGDSRPPF